MQRPRKFLNDYKERFKHFDFDEQGRRGIFGAIEVVRAISTLRGGSSMDLGRMDRLARSYVLLLGWVVTFQAAGTAVMSHRQGLFEVCQGGIFLLVIKYSN